MRMETVRNLVWGAPMLGLVLLCGGVCSVRLRWVQFRRFPAALRAGLGGGRSGGSGMSSLSATAAALAATVGTGNIAGVAGALTLGGPGAVFWMELAALLGMAVKYAEIALSVRHRRRDPDGAPVGGPMYYMAALPRPLRPLGRVYAFFGMLTAFGVGNLTQSNAVGASAAVLLPRLPGKTAALAAGVFTALLCARTYLGGAERVGRTAALLVPPMAVGYLAAAGTVIWVNRAALPAALGAIFTGAFRPQAVCGGAAGLTFRDALSAGLARGVFSNEAGLGSAAIAHGASSGTDPRQEGLLGIFEVFADTTVICTVTALAILTGGESLPYGTAAGAELAAAAFAGVFGRSAPAVTAAGMALFALTTVLTWGFYGARCAEFLLGRRAVRGYLACFCAAAVLGAAADLPAVWTLSEILNGLTAAPNLLALLVLTRQELRPGKNCGKLGAV
jgi:AGCS family alanine or glycine:cation symporter